MMSETNFQAVLLNNMRILKRIGKLINQIISYLLLSLVYLLGVTPVAIVAKLSGKHFLEIKPLSKETYWENTSDQENLIESYFKQF